MANLTLIPSAKVPLIYPDTNTMSTEWYRFFWNIYGFTGAGVVPVDRGGTGLNTIGDHQLIIGNTNNVFEPALLRGFGINVTYDPGFVNLSIGDSGVTPGTYGSASQVGVFTVNQYGVLTAASNASIAIAASQITSGTIASSLISGSYIGITGVGTLTAGTWNANTIGVAYGGTGQTSFTNGQLLIGNTTGNTLTKATLTAGTGVTITNGAGSITISATGTGGTVTSVSGTAPISVATGTTTPVISISQATTSTNGYLSSTDWNTFNNKQPAGTYVTSISIASSNGFTGTSSGGATPALTLATSVTGILKGNGTAISAATSGTDYAPATSGTSILYGNGAGGFSNVTIGTGVSFAGGTLSATGSGGTVTSVSGTGTVNGITLTGTVTSSGSLTLGGTLSGIGNSQLTNSTISGVALGGNLFNLTAGTGVSFSAGTTYNGSAAITINATGTGGTVTSVAMSVPSFLSVSGSPITTSGTLAVTLSGTALPVANGGTGATTFTAGRVLFGNGTSAINTSANFFWDNTNGWLGIGTSSPPSKLTIDGDGNVNTSAATNKGLMVLSQGGISSSTGGGGIEFKSSTFGSGYGAKINNMDDGSLAFVFRQNSASWTERLRFFGTGGVSIGNTTDPGATNLSVTGSVAGATFKTLSGTTGSVANGASSDFVTTAANKGHYTVSINAVGNTTVWAASYAYFDGGGTGTLVTIGAVGVTITSSGANKLTLTNFAGSAQSFEWSILRYK